MIDEHRTSSSLGFLLRLVAIAASMTLTGCISWMDSEVFERPASQEWAPGSVDGQRVRVIDELGVYRLPAASVVDAGLQMLLDPLEEGEGVDGIILGPGDQVEMRTAEAFIEVQRRADVDLRIAGRRGEVVITSAFRAGRCEVVAHQSVDVAEYRRIDRVSKSPRAYRVDGETMTPDEVDGAQAALWMTMPPVELGRLLTRAMGGCFVRPTGYVEEVIDSFYKRDDADAAADREYLQPVAGRKCSWELAFAGPEEEPLKVSGELVTAASGRVIVPVWEHAKLIRDNIDFGTVGRLTVQASGGRAASPPSELTVNLLQLSFEAPE